MIHHNINNLFTSASQQSFHEVHSQVFPNLIGYGQCWSNPFGLIFYHLILWYTFHSLTIYITIFFILNQKKVALTLWRVLKYPSCVAPCISFRIIGVKVESLPKKILLWWSKIPFLYCYYFLVSLILSLSNTFWASLFTCTSFWIESNHSGTSNEIAFNWLPLVSLSLLHLPISSYCISCHSMLTFLVISSSSLYLNCQTYFPLPCNATCCNRILLSGNILTSFCSFSNTITILADKSSSFLERASIALLSFSSL